MKAEYFFIIAAVLCLATFYVHTFVGGPVVVNPLLANQTLSKPSKWLNYYCWHNTTIMILAIGGGFVYSAINPSLPQLAYFGTILTAAFSILSSAVALKAKINPFRFPSTSLFASICFIGASGIYFLE